MSEAEGFGLLVADRGGAVRFETGLACVPEVRAAVLSGTGRCGTEWPALRTLRLGGTAYVVLRCGSADASLFVIRRHDEEGPLLDFLCGVDFAVEILRHFVCSPYEGMVVVDADARIRFMSPVHERFFGLGRGEAVGRPVTEVVENTRLHEVVRTGRAEIGRVHEMHGESRIVSRIPITRGGRVVGAIGQVMFKGPERVHELSRQVARLKAEVAYYERELSALRGRAAGLCEIIGDSDAMRRLRSDIARVARLDVPVLLRGESGTGKELVAHAIHDLSPRRDRPIVLVNSAALPASLVESELFGYEPGAFTGAAGKGHGGKLELADRGSLFLDEIGDMALEVQAKVLRVLQDGVFERLGGSRARRVDFRLITATNRDLERMLAGGAFRPDLYYRISGVVLELPPLRERLGDIPALVERFLHAYRRRHDIRVRYVHPEVYGYLRRLPWPGNVRQLFHEVGRAAIFCDSTELRVADFRPPGAAGVPALPPAPSTAHRTMRQAVSDVEATLIRESLRRHHGNKKRVAEDLGISRSYLYKRLRSL